MNNLSDDIVYHLEMIIVALAVIFIVPWTMMWLLIALVADFCRNQYYGAIEKINKGVII